MKKIWLQSVFFVVGIFSADRVSKHVASTELLFAEDPHDSHVYQGRRKPVWESRESAGEAEGRGFYMYIGATYVRNHGAAFGSFVDWNAGARKMFFVFMAVVGWGALGALLRWLNGRDLWFHFLICALGAGALGNSWDRAVYGFVIDWIEWRWRLWGWSYRLPCFNIADVVIVGSFLGLLVRGRGSRLAHSFDEKPS